MSLAAAAQARDSGDAGLRAGTTRLTVAAEELRRAAWLLMEAELQRAARLTRWRGS